MLPRYLTNPVRAHRPAPTVETFLTVLSSKVTQWDVQLSRRERHPNIYRIGHLLGAVGRVREDVQGLENESSPEAMNTLVTSIETHFTDSPPRRNVLKQIDAYLTEGKFPKV